MPDDHRSRALPPALRNRLLEAARACREECSKESAALPVADPAFARLYAVAEEIDALINPDSDGNRLRRRVPF